MYFLYNLIESNKQNTFPTLLGDFNAGPHQSQSLKIEINCRVVNDQVKTYKCL